MAEPTAPKTPESPLTRETRILRSLLSRLFNGILNYVFALTVEGSRRRSNALTVLFVLTGAVLILNGYPLSDWKSHLQTVFTSLMSASPDLTQDITAFGIYAFTAITEPRTLRLVPILVIPFTIGLYIAATYLADIFEIEDLQVALTFIREVALFGGNSELHISAAEIDEKVIEKSPIVQIGGPGKVTVELDTAILVEKPDGRPRVIGPTHGDETGILDGFERIRDMIDLRDQIPDPWEVGARSKDGIPISVADVRVVFSVFRDRKPPTAAEPHPFTPPSIVSMVYSKTSRVTEGELIHRQWYRSSGEPIWVTAMKGLVNGELSKLMGTRNLSEYLASIGTPETQAVQQIENAIAQQKQNLGGINGDLSQGGGVAPTPPPFTARPQLSGLFNEFSDKFNKDQQKRGVQAQWVGVGTWKMPPGVPSQVIPARHLEAWQLTLENLSRGSEGAISTLERDAMLAQLQRLVQKTPLIVHRDNAANPNQPRPQAINRLIQSYRQQLWEAIENTRKNKRRVPPSIVVAYFYLLRQFQHTPTPPPPAPLTPREARLYTELLGKVVIDEAIERLIELEREFQPNATREQLLESINEQWDSDMR